jgi:hypothetical protein
MSGVDTSRVPNGELAAKALVEAIAAGDDRVERHYLEVKSTLDLTTKKDQAKLAKFILGAANRMPDKALVAFNGHAVMVVGVAPAAVLGVPPIEALNIERAVAPFIGANGPKWDLIRVPVEPTQNDVLLLIVDPPMWGQPPFVCQKDGEEKLRDGAIFIRADGETREAKGAEVQELLRRGSVATHPPADFDVRIIGSIRPYKVDRERTLEEYISTTKQKLERALTLAKQQEAANQAAAAATPETAQSVIARAMSDKFSPLLSAMVKPESRSAEEYAKAIDHWETKTRQAWGVAVMRLLGGLLETAQVEVFNGEKTYFSGVQVEVHLEGKVFGTRAGKVPEEVALDDLGLPAPPREWGPTQAIPLGSSLFSPYLGSRYNLPSVIARSPRSTWNNSGSVDLSFDAGELRPKATKRSNDLNVVLYVSDRSTEHIHGTWQITAEGHNEIYSGELDIDVAEAADLTPLLRKLMGLDV